MKTFEGGTRVRQGTYVSLRTGEFVTTGGRNPVLPAQEKGEYLRVPIGMVLIAGPVIGLAYIIFLPLAGIGSLIMLAIHKVFGARMAPVDQESEG